MPKLSVQQGNVSTQCKKGLQCKQKHWTAKQMHKLQYIFLYIYFNLPGVTDKVITAVSEKDKK